MSAVIDTHRTTVVEAASTTPDGPDPAPSSGSSGPFSYRALSSLLRVLGAAVLTGSLSIFLFQGWHGGGDLHRFGLLLAFTGGLTGAGFATGHLIGEHKGARLFLALALAAVVTTFAVAGGLVHSAFGAAMPGGSVPAFVQWHAGSSTAAALAALGAVGLLAPVSWIGYRVLARRSAGTLTRLFLAANAALLVPVRDAEAVAVGLGVLTVALVPPVVRAVRTDPSLATAEGRFARLMVTVPLLVIAGRSLFLYSASALLFTTLGALAFVALRQVCLELPRSARLRSWLERVSVACAGATALGAGGLVEDVAHSALWLPTLALVFAAMLVELSLRSAGDGARLRRLASFAVTLGLTANLLLLPGIATAMLCVGIGLLVVVYGYSVEQKQVFGSGLVTLLVGLAYELVRVASLFALGDWSSLALLGTAAILLASVLERHGARARERVRAWHARIGGWQA